MHVVRLSGGCVCFHFITATFEVNNRIYGIIFQDLRFVSLIFSSLRTIFSTITISPSPQLVHIRRNKMTDKKEAIKRTGEMMLQGWKLLATCCPICHNALLSKAEQMMCAGCNLPVVVESKTNMASPTFQEVWGTPKNNVVHDEDQESSGISYDQMRADYDRKNSKRTAVSNMIGQKLLTGWTMTEYSCPDYDNCFGTPLMRQSGTEPFVCLSCNQTFELSTIGDIVRKRESNGGVSNVSDKHSEVIETKIVNEPLTTRVVGDKDSSWKISQKLLQGWALLDKVCELANCPGNVPLLKDRAGKVINILIV